MFDYYDFLPTQKTLKRVFVDSHIANFSQADLNCVSHMILAIDNLEEMVQAALGHLVVCLGANSADVGFLTPKDKFYQPTFIYGDGTPHLYSSGALTWPNQDGLFQQAWKSVKPVACSNVRQDVRITESSKQAFSAINSKSTLIQRLADGNQVLGLVCLDFTCEQHDWLPSEEDFIQRFTETFFAPFIAINQYWYKDNPLSHAKKAPTKSEMAAIRLAAEGMSYKEIAWELGKSVRTIENQLRHARSTVNAINQVDLIKKCQIWLD